MMVTWEAKVSQVARYKKKTAFNWNRKTYGKDELESIRYGEFEKIKIAVEQTDKR